jgi:hypothetical protein
VWIVAAQQASNRLGITEKIAEGNSPLAGLAARYAERGERRLPRIAAQNEDEMNAVQRFAKTSSFLLPVGAIRGRRLIGHASKRRGHCVAS